MNVLYPFLAFFSVFCLMLLVGQVSRVARSLEYIARVYQQWEPEKEEDDGTAPTD